MPIFHNRAQQIRNINNTLYLIKAIFPIDTMKFDRIDDMKSFLGCDIAFKVNKEGVFYFCSEIPSVEFEEI